MFFFFLSLHPSTMVSDADLHLASAALALATSVAARADRFPSAAAEVCGKVLPAALQLCQTPLIQRQALAALRGFFAAVRRCRLTSG